MVAILEMPESPTELGGWLDSVLMSDTLAVVVDELSAVHHATDEAISVDQARDWLGDSFPAVMGNGLGVLSHSRLRQLLVRPSLLPAMQELALVSGGPYWNHLASHGRPAALPARGSNRWLFAFVPLAVAASIAAFVAVDSGPNRGGITTSPHSDLTVTRGTDDSAGVVFYLEPNEPWGWNRTDLLDGIDSPEEIPGRLADSLSEWFDVAKSADADCQAFALHMNEMWAGCEQLSTQSFDGMTADLLQRIRDRIRALQEKVEGLLKKLDDLPSAAEATGVVKDVKQSVDACVRETVESLRRVK